MVEKENEGPASVTEPRKKQSRLSFSLPKGRFDLAFDDDELKEAMKDYCTKVP